MICEVYKILTNLITSVLLIYLANLLETLLCKRSYWHTPFASFKLPFTVDTYIKKCLAVPYRYLDITPPSFYFKTPSGAFFILIYLPLSRQPTPVFYYLQQQHGKEERGGRG